MELLLEIREEAKEFLTRCAAPAKLSAHTELARLQSIYAAQSDTNQTKREARLAALVTGYLQRLAKLRADLTRADDIDAALVVQAEMRRVEDILNSKKQGQGDLVLEHLETRPP